MQASKEQIIKVPNAELLEDISSMLQAGHSVELSAKGQSMSPFIRNGVDRIVLEKTADLDIFDIALARIKPDFYVVHRIIRISGSTITLMGDGNLQQTEITSRENILGTVSFIIKPNGKRVDCHSARAKRLASLWFRLLPIRRYILAIWFRTIGR